MKESIPKYKKVIHKYDNATDRIEWRGLWKDRSVDLADCCDQITEFLQRLDDLFPLPMKSWKFMDRNRNFYALEHDYSNLLPLAQRLIVAKQDEQFLSLPNTDGLVQPEAISGTGFRFNLICPDGESESRVEMTCSLGAPGHRLTSLCILSCRLPTLKGEANFTTTEPVFKEIISFWNPDFANLETADLGFRILQATNQIYHYQTLGKAVAWVNYYRGLEDIAEVPAPFEIIENYLGGTLITTGPNMPICPTENQIKILTDANIELLNSKIVSDQKIWPDQP